MRTITSRCGKCRIKQVRANAVDDLFTSAACSNKSLSRSTYARVGVCCSVFTSAERRDMTHRTCPTQPPFQRPFLRYVCRLPIPFDVAYNGLSPPGACCYIRAQNVVTKQPAFVICNKHVSLNLSPYCSRLCVCSTFGSARLKIALPPEPEDARASAAWRRRHAAYRKRLQTKTRT